MCIPVVPIPYRSIAGSGVVFETINHKLDCSSGIGNENEVEVLRIGAKESQCSFANDINAVTSNGRWCRRRVRVAVEVGDHVGRELLNQGFGV